MNLLDLDKFYCKNKDTYPPFKNGLYLEEYFLSESKNINVDKSGRLYIPILWTNFQIESWFQSSKQLMQESFDQYIKDHPSNNYFTICQYDDGPLLNLPPNTIVYGACSGDVPIPLIYEDIDNKLENCPKKSFNEKNIMCSFVGTLTHGVRYKINDLYKNNSKFVMSTDCNWNPNVSQHKQNNFIETTINSKFVLAPRGYGRSSFRFFEIFKLGSVPIYVWDDIEWLPYKDKLDYTKFCISINISNICILEEIISNITESQYSNMISEYNKIKHYFELPYLIEYIYSK